MFGRTQDSKQDSKKSSDENYTVSNNCFSMSLGSDWVDESHYAFRGPECDGIEHSININIEQNPEINELKAFAQFQIESLKNNLSGFQELKSAESLTDSGLPAYEYVYKWEPVPHTVIYQKMFFIMTERTAYKLLTTFSKKSWKMIGAEIDKIMRSFVPFLAMK
ncbi:MAG: DcrB-related protein [Gammaproteobacteria bacterium]|nr:DcrB-related protein [Gammaproteobacteria bacterium]MDH5727808.1 DcrB-related protein [Gammaproteobacteria bacterium]